MRPRHNLHAPLCLEIPIDSRHRRLPGCSLALVSRLHDLYNLRARVSAMRENATKARASR
jgi:hypothetical protein